MSLENDKGELFLAPSISFFSDGFSTSFDIVWWNTINIDEGILFRVNHEGQAFELPGQWYQQQIGGTTMNFDGAVYLARQLRDSHHLSIRAATTDGRLVTLEFDTSGFLDTIQPHIEELWWW